MSDPRIIGQGSTPGTVMVESDTLGSTEVPLNTLPASVQARYRATTGAHGEAAYTIPTTPFPTPSGTRIVERDGDIVNLPDAGARAQQFRQAFGRHRRPAASPNLPAPTPTDPDIDLGGQTDIPDFTGAVTSEVHEGSGMTLPSNIPQFTPPEEPQETGGAFPADETNTSAPGGMVEGNDIRAAILAMLRGGGGPSRASVRAAQGAAGDVAETRDLVEGQMRKKFRTESEGLADVAEQEANVAEQISGMRTRFAAQEEARFKAVSDTLDVIDQEIETLASGTIDPNRIFREPGSRLGAAIGIALSSAARAFGNAGGGAMAHVNAAIDRDLRAQQSDLARDLQAGATRISSRMSLLDRMSRNFGDQQTALLASKALMLEGAAARVRSIISGTRSVDAIRRGELLIAQIRNAQAEARYAAALQAMRRSGRGRRLTDQQFTVMREMADAADERIQDILQQEGGALPAPPGTRFVGGQAGASAQTHWNSDRIGTEGRVRMIESIGLVRGLTQGIDELVRLGELYGTESWDQEIEGRVRTLTGHLHRRYNQATGQGAIAQMELEDLQEFIPGATTASTFQQFAGLLGSRRTNARSLASLRALRDAVTYDLNGKLHGWGLEIDESQNIGGPSWAEQYGATED